jgi:hypothetical protein
MLRSPLVWRTASLDQIVIEMSAESPDIAPTSSTLKSNVQLALGSIGVMASSQLQSATKAHDRSAKESHCVAAD